MTDNEPFLATFITAAIFSALAVQTHAQEAEVTAEPPFAVRLLKARCIHCHGAPTMLGFSRKLLDEEGGEGLGLFLEKHHAPDLEAREEILRYLMQATGWQPPE